MKCKFIINPTSGRGKAGKLKVLDELESYFWPKLGNFDYVISRSQHDLIRQTRQAIRQGAERIVAVGGDGTVNVVAHGFFDNDVPINPQAELAIAKQGTGSDYFKSIEKRCGRVVDWRELVLKGRAIPVDLIRVVLSKGKHARLVVNIAGLGMSPEIVLKKENNPSWLPQSAGYLYPSLFAIPGYQAKPLDFDIDGEKFSMDIMGAFISKGSFSGGGMKFGGQVELDDGKMGVLLVPKFKMIECFAHVKTAYAGGFGNVPGVVSRTAKAIRVTSRDRKSYPVELDGEYVKGTPMEFSVMPAAIRLVCEV